MYSFYYYTSLPPGKMPLFLMYQVMHNFKKFKPFTSLLFSGGKKNLRNSSRGSPVPAGSDLCPCPQVHLMTFPLVLTLCQPQGLCTCHNYHTELSTLHLDNSYPSIKLQFKCYLPRVYQISLLILNHTMIFGGVTLIVLIK